jgi:hypothetical protein
MRVPPLFAILGLVGILAACGDEPTRYELVDPTDTAQVPGTLLAGHDLSFQATLEWIPGTERVAFASSVSGRWPIKTVDAASGLVEVVDSSAVGYRGVTGSYFREIVAAPDGRALYYVVGIGTPGAPEWVLRVADPAGGGVTTLRSRVEAALAMSPNGAELAYVVMGESREFDSLIVRTVADGSERYYGDYDGRDGEGGPILFSPDGTELLYGQWASLLWPLRRLSLGDGTGQPVTLPGGVTHAQLFHWGASGIQALAEVSGQYPSDYQVLTLSTGASVQVGTLPQGESVPYEMWIPGYEAWSRDGSRVAYWTGLCLKWTDLFDCGVARYALYVADARTGTRTRAAYVSGSAGPAVFSPDGGRIVYHNGEARGFYVVDVP